MDSRRREAGSAIPASGPPVQGLDDGWIKEEGAPNRRRYPIFNQPRAVPILDDEDDPDDSEAEPRPGHLQNGHDLE
jgi:hypothetical protein